MAKRIDSKIPVRIAFFCILLWVGGCFGQSAGVCAQEVDIDLDSIIQIESGWNPSALNKKDDSRGLCQITPILLKEWNTFQKDQYTMNDLYDPQINMRIAYWYLHYRIPQMLRYYKKEVNLRNVLWAYNAGISRVLEGVVPKITQDYFRKYEAMQ